MTLKKSDKGHLNFFTEEKTRVITNNRKNMFEVTGQAYKKISFTRLNNDGVRKKKSRVKYY